MNVTRGMRSSLDNLFDINQEIKVKMQIAGSAVYDFVCFGVDSNNKLSDDRYMIFYNQTKSPKKEIQYKNLSSFTEFSIKLNELPSNIQKLVFTASIDGSGTMGEISSHNFSIEQGNREKVTAQFNGKDFLQEKAITSFEIYRKNGWRFNVIARGFKGGLDSLLEFYGGENADEEPQPQSKPEPVSQPITRTQAQPVTRTQAQPITRTQAQSITRPQAQPITRPQAQPITRPQAQPITRTQAQPVTRPQEQPVTRTQEQPVTRTQAQPITRTQAQPVTRTQAQPITRPQAQPITRPQAQPVARPQAQPITRTQAQPVTRPQENKIKGSLEKKIQENAPKLISFVNPLIVELKKKNLENTTARVALAIDISDSMENSYDNGIIQGIVNKILPMAVQFDGNSELDFWHYTNKSQKKKIINMKNYESAVPKDWEYLTDLFGSTNNETVIMEKIIEEYKNSNVPVYVIFVTDGGIYEESKIKNLLIESSKFPIFWQFIGVSGSDYGILENLNKINGRYTDNAKFFAVDDFSTTPNSELYSQVLNKFPVWLEEAKNKRII